MSDILLQVSLPLDSDQFLRRECPFCRRQFKIETTEMDRQSLVEQQIQAYLIEEGVTAQKEESDVADEESSLVLCPYCGQVTSADRWWTQEQIAYIHVFAHNIMAQIVNEQFIRPMKRQFSGKRGGLISIKFEGKEMEYQDPWISPENDDMTVHALPCCGLRVKLNDDWSEPFHCYRCGFPHARHVDHVTERVAHEVNDASV